jgi:hypothetical protein
VPHEGTAPVRLTAPGLDATWSTTDRRGEALLGPVPPPVRSGAAARPRAGARADAGADSGTAAGATAPGPAPPEEGSFG